jgi:DNA-binding transcriptional LysR family regulator
MHQQDAFLATGFRHFLAVAEWGSVRAASRQINVAPSAISRQISLLEAHLGLPLFDRSGRNLLLLPAGEVLLKGLRTLSEGHEETLDHLSALRGLQRGRIRVATVESLTAAVIPNLLAEFNARYPGLQVKITVAGSDAVTEMVREHDADVCFTFNQTALEGLAVEVVCDLAVGAVMAPAHPLARSRKLLLAECADYPLAWPSRGLSLRGILDRVASGLTKSLQPVYECNSLRLMSSLAKRRNCISFQTEIGIEQDLDAGTLVFVPLADRRLPPDRMMVICRQGQGARLAVNEFITTAKRHLPKPTIVRKQRTE